MEALGLTLLVVGEVRPYVMKDDDTGEVISGANVFYPGGKVGLSLPVEVAQRLKEGQVWRIAGRGAVAASGKVRISEITEAKQLQAETEAAAPAAFEFLDASAATTTKRGAK